MSAPGFDVAPDDLRRRAADVDAVAATLRAARSAAATASAPEAFGILCSFFPALLAPAQQAGQAALDRAVAAVAGSGESVRAAATTYEHDDAAVAATLRGP